MIWFYKTAYSQKIVRCFQFKPRTLKFGLCGLAEYENKWKTAYRNRQPYQNPKTTDLAQSHNSFQNINHLKVVRIYNRVI